MGTGLLFAGALTGGAQAVGQLADIAIKERDQQAAQQSAIMARRNELMFEMKAKADWARQTDAAETAKVEQRRTTKNQAISGRIDANAAEALGTRYAEPVMGDEPLTPEQQAVFDEGMRRQRVEKERDKLRYTRDPENIVRAAVEEGFESPVTLMQNDTKQQIAQVRSDADTARRAQAVELALAKMEGKFGSKVPTGYRETPDGNLQAIPGGPADQKISGAFNADKAQLAGTFDSLNRLATGANELLSSPGLKGIVGIQGKFPNIPGSDAANAQALLETLKSQVGFGVLQAMRDASKTGGALGAVSDAEGKRLEANLAALSQAQSIEQFRASLGKIVEYSNGAKDRLREAFNLKHSDKAPATGAQPQAPATTAPKVSSRAELDALPSGALFTAPDGSVRRKP